MLCQNAPCPSVYIRVISLVLLVNLSMKAESVPCCVSGISVQGDIFPSPADRLCAGERGSGAYKSIFVSVPWNSENA